MNIILFSYVFSVALGQGAAILIGHLVGGERTDAAFILQKYGIKWICDFADIRYNRNIHIESGP